MRNHLIIAFTVILVNLTSVLYSQELNFVLEPGLGSFTMNDLKKINEMDLGSLPFDAKITNNFPMYWCYKSSLLFSFRRFVTLGITGCYQSTGSRVSRVDYSGEYSFDTRIRSLSPGVIAEFYYPVGKFRIALSNEAGLEFSKLNLIEHISVGLISNDDRYTFTAKNYYYEPAIKVTYPFSWIRVGINAGYLIDLKRGTLSGTDVNSSNLILSGGKYATSDWSGIRFSISLSCNMFQNFKTTSPPWKIFSR